jgi:hypothetical protein
LATARPRAPRRQAATAPASASRTAVAAMSCTADVAVAAPVRAASPGPVASPGPAATPAPAATSGLITGAAEPSRYIPPRSAPLGLLPSPLVPATSTDAVAVATGIVPSVPPRPSDSSGVRWHTVAELFSLSAHPTV